MNRFSIYEVNDTDSIQSNPSINNTVLGHEDLSYDTPGTVYSLNSPANANYAALQLEAVTGAGKIRFTGEAGVTPSTDDAGANINAVGMIAEQSGSFFFLESESEITNFRFTPMIGESGILHIVYYEQS